MDQHAEREFREFVQARHAALFRVGDPAGDVAQRLALASVLAQLTKRQRAVIVLRYYEDLPEAEVAAILGCSVGTVRSQTSRSLTRLRVLYPEGASVTSVKEAA